MYKMCIAQMQHLNYLRFIGRHNHVQLSSKSKLSLRGQYQTVDLEGTDLFFESIFTLHYFCSYLDSARLGKKTII
jgi:hypothetical protein